MICPARESSRRPFWVKNVVATVWRPFPLYPDEQSFSHSVGMSQTCQQETHAPLQTASLFDHLAGAGNQCRWHFEAACYRDSECQAAPGATRKKGIHQR
jgi:hypothetical protein